MRRRGIPVAVGLAGALCPDHYFVSNVEDCLAWGLRQGFDMLLSESAGLCNRCSPHIAGVLAVCVVDALAGVHTPKKIGPMLRLADLVVITKGDIVSQVEREVFAYHVRLANPGAPALFCNGITGQGAMELARQIRAGPVHPGAGRRRLRFPMPAAVCPYCVGETAIGETHQRGNVKKMQFADLRSPLNAIADMPLDALLAAQPCVADFIASLGLRGARGTAALSGTGWSCWPTRTSSTRAWSVTRCWTISSV